MMHWVLDALLPELSLRPLITAVHFNLQPQHCFKKQSGFSFQIDCALNENPIISVPKQSLRVLLVFWSFLL